VSSSRAAARVSLPSESADRTSQWRVVHASRAARSRASGQASVLTRCHRSRFPPGLIGLPAVARAPAGPRCRVSSWGLGPQSGHVSHRLEPGRPVVAIVALQGLGCSLTGSGSGGLAGTALSATGLHGPVFQWARSCAGPGGPVSGKRCPSHSSFAPGRVSHQVLHGSHAV
jgi:hypothetical protein